MVVLVHHESTRHVLRIEGVYQDGEIIWRRRYTLVILLSAN